MKYNATCFCSNLSQGIRIIKDPETARLLGEENRRRMLHMLRHREMSVTDLAKALDKPHSSVQHHLNLLRDVGLVTETRQEKVRNMVQPFYRATAHRFIISYSLTEALADDEAFITWRRSQRNKIIDGLREIGITFPLELKAEIDDLITICVDHEVKAFEESLEKVNSPNIDRHTQRAIVQFLTQFDLAKDEKHILALKRLNQIMKV